MTTPVLPFGSLHTDASEALCRLGWTQGMERAVDGSMCLTGALKACSPQPGDWTLARAVYRRHGHGEGWNDNPGRTADEVIEYLAATPVKNDDLIAVFGPQWEAIVALVLQAAILTSKDEDILLSTYNKLRSLVSQSNIDAAWAAMRYAAGSSALHDNAQIAAWNAITDTRRANNDNNSIEVIKSQQWAVCALAVRDLIGQERFTQDDYDILTGSWATAIGLVHPADRAY